jgi:adenylate cyclase
MTRAEQWHTVLRVVAIVAPLGALIGVVPGYFLGEADAQSIVAGGLIGLLISGGVVTFDVAWAVGLIPRGWREAPFLVVLVTRSLVWLAIIVIGIALPLLTVADLPPSELVESSNAIAVAVSLALALLFNFVAQVNRLLGSGVLVGLIVGRYHRPREEVRIFLLVDLKGSSQIAGRLGNLRYHGFLKRFIADITAAAMRHSADVHRYVGDEVIFTWDERRGLENAACVRSVFAMVDAIEVGRAEYSAEYGIVPSFRAGLHLGPVVTGEIGAVKHEIAYLGETLNAAARIEEACRDLQRPFLASSDVIDGLELPTGVEAENLGPVELRGIANPVELLAISRTN